MLIIPGLHKITFFILRKDSSCTYNKYILITLYWKYFSNIVELFSYFQKTFQKNIHTILLEYYYKDARLKDARLKKKQNKRKQQEEKTLKQALGRLQLSKPKAMTKNSQPSSSSNMQSLLLSTYLWPCFCL